MLSIHSIMKHNVWNNFRYNNDSESQNLNFLFHSFEQNYIECDGKNYIFQQVKTRTVRESDYSPAIALSEEKDIL